MKARLGFVSNSSSSSFIVIGKKPIATSVRLTPNIAKKVIQDFNRKTRKQNKEYDWSDESLITWDGNTPVYLTLFLADGGDYTDLLKGTDFFDYEAGSHTGPYTREKYIPLIYEEEPDNFYGNVWLPRKFVVVEENED